MENELTFKATRVIGAMVGRRASCLNGCEIDGVDRASGMQGIEADETSLKLKVGLCGECLVTHMCIGSCKLGMVML